MFHKRFPFFHQHDANDCGPACLQMISAYYGKRFSLEYIREQTSMRIGISMLGVYEAASKLGFRVLGAWTTYGRLKELPLPCIVYWNQNHFVVVYKIDPRRDIVYLANPVLGLVKLSKEEFCRCWVNTGYQESKGAVLFLEPTSAFYKHEIPAEKRGKFFSLLRYLRPFKK